MVFNINMKVAHLLENEPGAALFDRFLPGMKKMVSENPRAAALSVEQLVRYTRIPKGEEILKAMDAALEELNTPENMISPAEAKQIAFFRELNQQDKEKAQKVNKSHTQGAIYPGQSWLDTKGEPIQAHGGAVYYEDGIYYWYGENKEHTDGKNGVWTWGIKVYSSTDLYNWKDRGFLIPPVLDDPNSALFPTKRVDRPHILKCPKTGKYVCWIKLSGPEAAFTIWQADCLLGPYELVENLYNPGGHKAGDFDMIADDAAGKGYIYFDADHASMLCMELSEDYLHADKEVARSYPNLTPPFTREAPALFEANGKKYMLTSGMTGYIPNRSDCAAADSWDMPFVSIGDPHVEDESRSSFNSQISKVFRVAGTDTWIAMADRWIPDMLLDGKLADLIERVIGASSQPEHFSVTEEERTQVMSIPAMDGTSINTSMANYVWLPICFKDDKPVIEWTDAWTILS